jgi:hypothetical protein
MNRGTKSRSDIRFTCSHLARSLVITWTSFSAHAATSTGLSLIANLAENGKESMRSKAGFIRSIRRVSV